MHRICSVDGCEKRARSRGWCSMHYRRWRITGDLGPSGTLRVPAPLTPCSVPDCERLKRSSGAEYCEMHYARMYRKGTLEVRPIYTNEACLTDGCDRERTDIGMCDMHATRLRRHGDPAIVIGVTERKYRRGEDNPAWVGDQPSYATAHRRVREARGRAPKFRCVDCGHQAKHWSYDHTDPNELVTDEGYHYSADINHYVPRCVPCHKRHDLAISVEATP